MSNKLYIIILLLFSMSNLFASSKTDKSIYFQQDNYNWNNVELNKKFKQKILLINNSEFDISEYKIRTNCGCLKIIDKPKTIKKNSKVEITLEGYSNEEDKMLRENIIFFKHKKQVASSKIKMNFIIPAGITLDKKFCYWGRKNSFLEVKERNITVSYRPSEKENKILEKINLNLVYDESLFNIRITKKLLPKSVEWEITTYPTIHAIPKEYNEEVLGTIINSDKITSFKFNMMGDILENLSYRKIELKNAFLQPIELISIKKNDIIKQVLSNSNNIEKIEDTEKGCKIYFNSKQYPQKQYSILFLKNHEQSFVYLYHENISSYPFHISCYAKEPLIIKVKKYNINDKLKISNIKIEDKTVVNYRIIDNNIIFSDDLIPKEPIIISFQVNIDNKKYTVKYLVYSKGRTLISIEDI